MAGVVAWRNERNRGVNNEEALVSGENRNLIVKNQRNRGVAKRRHRRRINGISTATKSNNQYQSSDEARLSASAAWRKAKNKIINGVASKPWHKRNRHEGAAWRNGK